MVGFIGIADLILDENLIVQYYVRHVRYRW